MVLIFFSFDLFLSRRFPRGWREPALLLGELEFQPIFPKPFKGSVGFHLSYHGREAKVP